MRNKILVFVGLICLTYLLSGCAALVPSSIRKSFGYGVESSKTCKISVNSEPAGATVYLNDLPVGVTPCEDLPISIKCIDDTDILGQSFGSHNYSVTEQYYLRVSKEGYKDAIEPLKFTSVGNYYYGSPEPEKSEFNFVLEKQQN